MSPTSGDDRDILKDRSFLVIEDCEDHLLLYSNYLKLSGARVTAACTETDALARLAEATFDAILIDVQITGVLVFDLMAEIRRRGHQGSLIALSMYDASDVKADCLRSGCTSFMQKPILYRPFLRTIVTDLKNVTAEA